MSKDKNMINLGCFWINRIGWMKSKLASDLIIGDKLKWDNNYISSVLKITHDSTNVTLMLSDVVTNSLKTYNRIINKDNIVLVSVN